jgi:hypothetical protein
MSPISSSSGGTSGSVTQDGFQFITFSGTPKQLRADREAVRNIKSHVMRRYQKRKRQGKVDDGEEQAVIDDVVDVTATSILSLHNDMNAVERTSPSSHASNNDSINSMCTMFWAGIPPKDDQVNPHKDSSIVTTEELVQPDYSDGQVVAGNRITVQNSDTTTQVIELELVDEAYQLPPYVEFPSHIPPLPYALHDACPLDPFDSFAIKGSKRNSFLLSHRELLRSVKSEIRSS